MPSSRLTKEELKEDTNHILHTLWNSYPSRVFYDAFESAAKGGLVDYIVIVTMMFTQMNLRNPFPQAKMRLEI